MDNWHRRQIQVLYGSALCPNCATLGGKALSLFKQLNIKPSETSKENVCRMKSSLFFRKLSSKVRVLEKAVKANIGGPDHEVTSRRIHYFEVVRE